MRAPFFIFVSALAGCAAASGPRLRRRLEAERQELVKSWVVTPEGLVLIFEEYQLVAYAEGEPKVLIPFDRLKEIARPQGALAKFAAAE